MASLSATDLPQLLQTSCGGTLAQQWSRSSREILSNTPAALSSELTARSSTPQPVCWRVLSMWEALAVLPALKCCRIRRSIVRLPWARLPSLVPMESPATIFPSSHLWLWPVWPNLLPILVPLPSSSSGGLTAWLSYWPGVAVADRPQPRLCWCKAPPCSSLLAKLLTLPQLPILPALRPSLTEAGTRSMTVRGLCLVPG